METPQGVTTPISEWRTSSRCTGGECVEVAFAGGGVALRDSKNREQGILLYSADAWRAFVADVKTGRHDLRK